MLLLRNEQNHLSRFMNNLLGEHEVEVDARYVRLHKVSQHLGVEISLGLTGRKR